MCFLAGSLVMNAETSGFSGNVDSLLSHQHIVVNPIVVDQKDSALARGLLRARWVLSNSLDRQRTYLHPEVVCQNLRLQCTSPAVRLHDVFCILRRILLGEGLTEGRPLLRFAEDALLYDEAKVHGRELVGQLQRCPDCIEEARIVRWNHQALESAHGIGRHYLMLPICSRSLARATRHGNLNLCQNELLAIFETQGAHLRVRWKRQVQHRWWIAEFQLQPALLHPELFLDGLAELLHSRIVRDVDSLVLPLAAHSQCPRRRRRRRSHCEGENQFEV
mmetsp:Transcript_30159/g.45443  ORF Transcript_30159/g.45443 Transcript_30159/m.45443 type:complete len:277 (-) Transcript_30159:12-842(-)